MESDGLRADPTYRAGVGISKGASRPLQIFQGLLHMSSQAAYLPLELPWRHQLLSTELLMKHPARPKLIDGSTAADALAANVAERQAGEFVASIL